MFTKIQEQQIKNQGINIDIINNQLQIFEKGFKFLKIEKPANTNDGILKFSNKQINDYIEYYENFIKNNEPLKFVPASGAASRMFKDLFEFYNNSKINIPDKTDNNTAYEFFDNIKKFAFFEQLNNIVKEKTNLTIEEHINKNNFKTILEYFLTDKGLNYGHLPKALICFHKYDKEKRTSFEEHIVEGLMYAKSKNDKLNLHFTISEEHTGKIKSLENKLLEKYNDKKIQIEYSYQDKKTNTIAVDLNNKPFVLDNGKLLFRPGGHGALIHNLNNIKSDLIFIKNIDNVVVDNLKNDTVKYKKLIAGCLLHTQNEIFEKLEELDKNPNTELSDIEELVTKKLQIELPANYDKLNSTQKKEFLKNKLNRPIRVCGMVKNQGEPGGGPFWVKHFDNSKQLQIVEKSQIDLSDKNQKKIMQNSKFFNPVDLVISTKTYKGDYFNLEKFIDNNTFFISKKSINGKELKALELPGLWNGAMSDWNTIFIEVPLTTFNPVKVITDLLRTFHISE